MAFWKLTENVWFGDRGSPEETRDTAKSVISLAYNSDLRDKPHRNPYYTILPALKPYFWFPRPDESPPDEKYLSLLDKVILGMHSGGFHPMLVHCWGGQHRSPATAIYAQLLLEGFCYKRYVELTTFADNIRGGCGRGDFARGLHDHMVALCKKGEERC